MIALSDDDVATWYAKIHADFVALGTLLHQQHPTWAGETSAAYAALLWDVYDFADACEIDNGAPGGDCPARP